VCVRACVRARVRARMRARVRACVRVHVSVRVTSVFLQVDLREHLVMLQVIPHLSSIAYLVSLRASIFSYKHSIFNSNKQYIFSYGTAHDLYNTPVSLSRHELSPSLSGLPEL